MKMKLALLAAVALLVTSITAEARVKGPRGLSSIAIGCGNIQDKIDRAISDMRRARRNKDRRAYNAALARSRNAVQDWYALGCNSVFGRWWNMVREKNMLNGKAKWSNSTGNVFVAPTRKKWYRSKIRRFPRSGTQK